MWPNPEKTADLVTFAEEILNEKLHFCAVEYVAYAGIYPESIDSMPLITWK